MKLDLLLKGARCIHVIMVLIEMARVVSYVST